MEPKPLIETEDEVEELIAGRVQEIVSKFLAGITDSAMADRIKAVIAAQGLKFAPVIQVPKGEPPVAQFEVSPKFTVPSAPPAPVTVEMRETSDALGRIEGLLADLVSRKRQFVSEVTERDANGRIQKMMMKEV